MWAPQCDTLSRNRDIPIPGRSNPPQLIRSSGAVRGLPGLRPDLQHWVEQANSFVDSAWECIHEALPRNRAAAIEGPACSWLWQFDQAKAAAASPYWTRNEYWQCAHGGSRQKHQAIESNVEEMEIVAAQCHHPHSEGEWSPYQVDLYAAQGSYHQSWVYPAAEEAEYTASLCFHIAVALSMWAIRVRGIKMAIPRLPPKSEVGNREGWAALPKQLHRRWLMAPMAVAMGCKPPKTALGKWFASEWIRARCTSCARLHDVVPASG